MALSNEVGTELKPAAETADSWAAASVAATELEAVEDEAFNTSAGADSLRMDDCASLKWSSPESRLPGPDEVKKSTPGVEDLNMEADTELGGATEPPPAV